MIVLQVGRLVPRKGVDNAICGVAQLVHRHDLPARLLVVGGNSDVPDPALTPEIARLRKIAAGAGIEERVTFVGRRSRELLKLYYSAADVFVTTPWYEPFGITPLEAMACATPVIGARVGGVKYSVLDGETGYLVPPDQIFAAGATTLFGTIVSIFVLAGIFKLIAPMYDSSPSYVDALKVATFGAIPVLLAGATLFIPAMVIVSGVGLCHSLFLYWVGVGRVLAVSTGSKSEFIGISMTLLGGLSTLIGAMASSVGMF